MYKNIEKAPLLQRDRDRRENDDKVQIRVGREKKSYIRTWVKKKKMDKKKSNQIMRNWRFPIEINAVFPTVAPGTFWP